MSLLPYSGSEAQAWDSCHTVGAEARFTYPNRGLIGVPAKGSAVA